MNLIIIGPPGSGKGTQSKLLSINLNLYHISSGDILRDEIKKEFGRKISVKIQKGEFISDTFMAEMVMCRIGEVEGGKGIILDGFPRNLYQIPFVTIEISGVIFLNVSKDICKKRVFQRNENRSDDSDIVFENRWELYERSTLEVVEYYRNKGKVVEVDGSRSKEEIRDFLVKYFKK
ncbi:adenylate kinase [Hamiltosporidium magnivora]|uniref:Adenylate kinase n=2 Tax=Hamiltosporidium magnivora TaxID=148818 RepID=A0A4Q9LM96_9MICR|nr:adenylate kinase [Hamiltosporidium magnivora]